MTLRFSRPTDRAALTALWQTAFGDTKETVDLFFDTCYRAENTLTAIIDGKIASALYILENTLQTENGDFSAAYIYAAATAPEYRRQGLMTALLEFALTTAQTRGWDYLYLVPASADLYRYYGERGFETAFFKRTTQISREELSRIASGEALPLPYSPHMRFCVRAHALRGIPHIVWSRSTLDFAEKLETAFGTNSVFFRNGFAVWEQAGKTAHVCEFCCTSEARPETAKLLLERCTAQTFTLDTPVKLFPTRGKTLPSGMLQAVSARAKAQSRKNQNLYLGMTLG